MMTPASMRRFSGTPSATRAAPTPHSPPMPRPAIVRQRISCPRFVTSAHALVPAAYSAYWPLVVELYQSAQDEANEQIEDNFEYSPGRRLVSLYARTGRKAEARKLVLYPGRPDPARSRAPDESRSRCTTFFRRL